MFWKVLGTVLTPGVGAALSPLMIVAATIMASTKGGARKALTFALGDFVAMAGLGIAAAFVAGSDEVATSSGPSQAKLIVRVIFGLFLWFMAWQTYKKRPAKGETSPAVAKLSALDQMSSPRILLLGVTFGLLNAKNLPLTISVGTSVSQTGAGTALKVIGMLVFAALGTSAVLAPGVIRLVAPNDAERVLGAARNFFEANNTTIMVVLYLLLGANLVGENIGALLA